MPVYRGGKPPITYGTFYSGGGYLPGVIALARSLKGVSSCVPLTVFADKGLGADQRALLERNGISVSVLDEVTVPDSVKRLNDVGGFSHWNRSFLKLRIFSQTDWSKIVLLDADMMVVRNIDALFDLPHMSAVVAGQGCHPDWIDLNSGLMVIEPEEGETDRMLDLLGGLREEELAEYAGIGDQDVVQLAYPDWSGERRLHLPETYNLFSDCLARYLKLGIVDEESVRVVHFECSPKPWSYGWKDWARIFRRALRWGSTAEVSALRRYRSLYAGFF